MENDEIKKEPVDSKFLKKATFAGGCFWCMEAAFEELDGVIDVISGYSGGEEVNPTYKDVSSGKTGHYEAIQITFDSSNITYGELMDFFWRQIDPTDAGGQFVDRGAQYRSAIFYHDEAQKEAAENSTADLSKSGKLDEPMVTKILPYTTFYKAEEYHQDYSKKRTLQYQLYKKGSGRGKRLSKLWENQLK
ncbi:MAG: peptide-methionine (S)-S-oxide reductase MsrA [Candidatus Hydrothermarchaeaceae archaeon]